nr:MAG TPA: hypothetical protein [Caudoviricetes sp.]
MNGSNRQCIYTSFKPFSARRYRGGVSPDALKLKITI